MKTIAYKNFQASVEYDDGALFVRVLHIDDVLISQCTSVAELMPSLRALIDDYLTECEKIGRAPQKPFSGSLNIRIGNDLHRGASVAAAERGMTLNSWIGEALSEKLQCDSLAERMDGLVSDVGRDLQVLQLASISVSDEATELEDVETMYEDILQNRPVASEKGEWRKLDG